MYNPAKTLSILPLLLLLLATTACAPNDGGQVGEETFVCAPALTEELSVDDSTPLGFTVSEVLMLAASTHQSPLLWADDNSTVLTVTMSYASRATYQDREWMGTDADGREDLDIGTGDCLDILNLEMNLQLMTDDGALNEDFRVDLQAASVTEAGFNASLDAPAGSLAIEAFAPAGSFESYTAALDLVIDANGMSGTISGQAVTAATGGGDDGVVSATQYPIASFGE